MELTKHVLLNLDLVFMVVASLIGIVVISKKLKNDRK